MKPKTSGKRKEINPLKALFKGVGSAELSAGRVGVGTHLLRIDDVSLGKSRSNIDIMKATGVIVQTDSETNRVGQEVSIIVSFGGDYWDRDIKAFTLLMCDVGTEEVDEDEITEAALAICGLTPEAEPLPEAERGMCNNTCLKLEVYQRAKKSSKESDKPEMSTITDSVQILTAEETLDALGQELFDTYFVDGVRHPADEVEEESTTETS